MALLSSSTQQPSRNALKVIPADATTLRSMATGTSQPDTRVSPQWPQMSLLDVDGLRCEVRTMRSVPHILFSTPYVSQCIGTYVRQLIDDFTHSLLLCRHSNSRPFSSCVIQGEGDDALPPQQSTTAATPPEVWNPALENALASDDEETYLLLRLCALDKSAKRPMRSGEPSDSAPPAGWGGWAKHDANSGAVTEQLVALFAAAGLESRRRGPSSGVRIEGSSDAVSMPPLLSSLLLFKPMLQDMRYLAQHLLLPRYAWQHHQREWIIVHEDVTVTLRDRLSRSRLAAVRRSVQDGAELTGKENAEGRSTTRSTGNTAAPTAQRYLFSSTELHRLWHTLWKLLGAAWRQRDRLWGAYRYVHGPHRLPPMYLSSEAPHALPPGVHSSPIVREQHACRATGRPAPAPAHDAAAALEAAHDEDTCAFGPFTSVDIGISAGRKYVLRHPLAAALRSLRVAVPPTGRDPLVTSTAAFSDFQYVGDSASCPRASTARDLAAPLTVPLFDPTDQDVQLAVASAPYVSPEVYIASQQEQLRWNQQQDPSRRRAPPCRASPAPASPPWPPVHTFSDDVWNAAVVVLEAALSGFCAMDASMCHLALASAHDRDMNAPDQPTTRSDDLPLSSPSVYSDVVLLLTERHTLPTAAAYNFVYAALHHLQVSLKRGEGGAGEEDGDDNVVGVNAQQRSSIERGGATTLVLLSPLRLAREWRCYLRTAYGTACLQEKGILTEVATKGLCWRRSERWNALAMAHATETLTKDAAQQQPHGAGAGAASPSPSIAAVTIAADADTHADVAYAPGDVRREESLPSPAVEAVSVHQRVPASTDTAGARGAGTSPPHAHQIIRAINALDTPLLRILSLGHGRAPLKKGVCSVGTWTAATNQNKAAGDAGDLWISLDRYLRRCTTTSSSSAAGGGGAAAPAEMASGAVGSAAADVDGADGLLRLLFRCLIHATRSRHCVNDAARADHRAVDTIRCEYTALNHPFFRGFAERGLLTTCVVTACCPGGRRTVTGGKCSDAATGVAAAATLPALNLYVPSAVLLATLHELETAQKRNDDERGLSERLFMQATSLRTLIGDDMRAWESSAVTRAAGNGGIARAQQQQQQQQYPLCTSSLVNMPTTCLPPPVHRARRALDHVLTPMDFDLAAQLQHTGPLRRLLHASSDHNAAGGSQKGTGRKAQRLNPVTTTTSAALMRLRIYLKHLLTPDTRLSTADSATGNVAYSPFYPIPPTLRGEVWGRLLQVPPSAYTREALLAHAVHNTAAKPMEQDRQLSVDIPRCHAYHPLLSSALVSGQLRRILRAWMYLHPEYTYWQGLDSVCAVLLTVNHTDEALVLAQLNAIVDRFIAHDEGDRGPQWTGVGAAGMRGMQRASATAPLMPPLEKPSMAELLHRVVVVVRYCDPLLAHHLFDALGCTPELYAISWLLTLFSHTLPARKVYHLWDLLLVEGDINGLVAMCAAVMIHKRERLLSADFSGCLAAFSSSASAVDVTAAVGDTRLLLMAVPPSVLWSSDKSKSSTNTMHGCGHRGADEAMDGPLREKGGDGVASVALLDVEDVAAALAVARSFTPTAVSHYGEHTTSAACGGKRWFHGGVYLVDLRELPSGNTSREVVLGAIRVPLCPAAHAGSHLRGTSVSTAAAAAAEAGLSRRSREPADVPPRDIESEMDDADNGDVGAGWGVVERQEQLQEQHRAAQHAVARRVEEVAAVIVRHLGNPALATVLPQAVHTDENIGVQTPSQQQQQQPSSFLCPWPVHPIVRKMSRAPHVVLLTSGIDDAHELPLAHQLGLKLNACGVHNVSVLRGGVASVRSALPQLILSCASSTQ